MSKIIFLLMSKPKWKKTNLCSYFFTFFKQFNTLIVFAQLTDVYTLQGEEKGVPHIEMDANDPEKPCFKAILDLGQLPSVEEVQHYWSLF